MNYRAKAKQEWKIGNKVNVGFLKNLEITDTINFNGKTEYSLKNDKGETFVFVPHEGLFRN